MSRQRLLAPRSSKEGWGKCVSPQHCASRQKSRSRRRYRSPRRGLRGDESHARPERSKPPHGVRRFLHAFPSLRGIACKNRKERAPAASGKTDGTEVLPDATGAKARRRTEYGVLRSVGSRWRTRPDYFSASPFLGASKPPSGSEGSTHVVTTMGYQRVEGQWEPSATRTAKPSKGGQRWPLVLAGFASQD